MKKNKKRMSIWRRILFVFSATLILLGMSVILFRLFYVVDNKKNVRQTKEIRKELQKGDNDNNEDFLNKLKELFNNSDVIGYLVVDGTEIEYPIVQGKDNNVYLRTDLYGNYNMNGSIFMDCDNHADFSDSRTVIYGHNMVDGAMFGNLEDYFNNSVEGRTFTIYTRTNTLKYDILCSSVINAYGRNEYIGESNETMVEFFNILKSNSHAWNSNIQLSDLSDEDKVVTLMTCYQDGSTYRFGVTGLLKSEEGTKDENKQKY